MKDKRTDKPVNPFEKTPGKEVDSTEALKAEYEAGNKIERQAISREICNKMASDFREKYNPNNLDRKSRRELQRLGQRLKEKLVFLTEAFVTTYSNNGADLENPLVLEAFDRINHRWVSFVTFETHRASPFIKGSLKSDSVKNKFLSFVTSFTESGEKNQNPENKETKKVPSKLLKDHVEVESLWVPFGRVRESLKAVGIITVAKTRSGLDRVIQKVKTKDLMQYNEFLKVIKSKPSEL